MRSRNKGVLDTHAWSLSGNKGNVWQQAHVPINPSGPFQVSPPGPAAGPLPVQEALGKARGLPLGAGEESRQEVGWGAPRFPEGKGSLSCRTSLTPAPCSLTPSQIIFEGVRGSGYLGDIAIDDVTLKKGECPRKQMDPNKGEDETGVWDKSVEGCLGEHL